MPDPQAQNAEPVCWWCKKALTGIEAWARWRVCRNCVRLLEGAGIPDTEIYGRTDEEDEKD